MDHQVWPYSDIGSNYSMRDYQAEWPKYQNEQGNAPSDAKDCKNETQLKAWYHSQVATIKEWVPEAMQNRSLASLHKELEVQRARLNNSTSKAASSSSAAAEKPAELAAQSGDKKESKSDSDLQQYFKEAQSAGDKTESSSSGQSSFNHYIPAAYQKFFQYTPGDYQKYMDFQKYMDHQVWPYSDIGSNYSMRDYQAEWPKYQNEQGNAPSDAKDCKNETQLKAWYHSQVATIKEWVPEAMQNRSLASLHKELEVQRARLNNSTSQDADSNANADADSKAAMALAPVPITTLAAITASAACFAAVVARLPSWREKSGRLQQPLLDCEGGAEAAV